MELEHSFFQSRDTTSPEKSCRLIVQDKTNIRFVRSSYGPYNVFFIGADIIKTIRAMVPQLSFRIKVPCISSSLANLFEGVVGDLLQGKHFFSNYLLSPLLYAAII